MCLEKTGECCAAVKAAWLAGYRTGSYTGGPAKWQVWRWGRPLKLTFLGLRITPVKKSRGDLCKDPLVLKKWKKRCAGVWSLARQSSKAKQRCDASDKE